MDKRDTLIAHATFLELLESLKRSQQKASLLVDSGGIGREEGLVMDISKEGEETLVYLSNGHVVKLQNIIAVNGTFLSDYSEC